MSSTPCPTQSLNQGWQNKTSWCLPGIIPFFFKGKRGFLFHIMLSKFIPLSEIRKNTVGLTCICLTGCNYTDNKGWKTEMNHL